MMDSMKDYLDTIQVGEHRLRLEEIFNWININFPLLNFKIAWNQPMYTHHDTFIIGFSTAKKHIAISPEAKGIQMFSKDITAAGYTHSKHLFCIRWNDEIDYKLLKDIITYNLDDKADCISFWRK